MNFKEVGFETGCLAIMVAWLLGKLTIKKKH